MSHLIRSTISRVNLQLSLQSFKFLPSVFDLLYVSNTLDIVCSTVLALVTMLNRPLWLNDLKCQLTNKLFYILNPTQESSNYEAVCHFTCRRWKVFFRNSIFLHLSRTECYKMSERVLTGTLSTITPIHSTMLQIILHKTRSILWVQKQSVEVKGHRKCSF